MTGSKIALAQILSYGGYTSAVLLFNYYGINTEGFIVLAILLTADVILGVTKSWVLHGDNGDWFSSRKLKVGVISKIVILFFVVLFAIAIKQYAGELPSQLAVQTVLSILSIAEFISIIQNSIMVITKKEIEEWDAVSLVLKRILDILRVFINEKIDHTDDGNN